MQISRDTKAGEDEECKGAPASTFETGTPAVEMRHALERADVVSLPAFRPLGDVKLHCLALLQALEAACLDRREVHKNIFATLTADEAVAFGVIEPLYCSLFCHVVTGVPFDQFTLEGIRGAKGRYYAGWQEAAQ
jgi:hypothetical protein